MNSKHPILEHSEAHEVIEAFRDVLANRYLGPSTIQHKRNGETHIEIPITGQTLWAALRLGTPPDLAQYVLVVVPPKESNEPIVAFGDTAEGLQYVASLPDGYRYASVRVR